MTKGLVLLFAFAVGALAQLSKLPPDIDPQSFSRLPLIPKDKLDAEGKKIFEAINGKDATLPRLGPAAITMYDLPAAEPFDKLNQAARNSTVGPRLFELCALIPAREFDQQYMWSAHEVAAVRAGLEQSVIDAIKYDRPLDGLAEKDATVIQFGRDVLRRHAVSPELYQKVVGFFGRQGMMEIAIIIGDYTMTTVVLNAIDQRLPPDRKALLPERR